MQVINLYKKKKEKKRAIWKPSREWSCFVDNVLLGVKDVSTYKKKNVYIYWEMLRPRHFYNKSQVVSYYWFKFEPNTKITFLPQQ